MTVAKTHTERLKWNVMMFIVEVSFFFRGEIGINFNAMETRPSDILFE